MEIGGVPNIRWNEGREGVLESQPALRTSGYTMNLLYIPPNKEHKLEGGESIACLLRGSVISEYDLPVRKSLLLTGEFAFKSGENGCLLFVCRDEGDNHKYLDDISGLEVKWDKKPTMYMSEPSIHVDDYSIDWKLLDSTFDNMVEDTNKVYIRVYDGSSNLYNVNGQRS